MNNPRLTVVVPTRERADTLRHTLRTLIAQDYQDCEFLVSDNFSQDDTSAVVAEFSDTRLRYVNTGKRLSMAQNWEFALDHARGEFITYIGDDDGFIPGALAGAMRIINTHGGLALVWEKAEYCWPDYIDAGMRNSVSTRVTDFSLTHLSGAEERVRVLAFKTGYTRLPCLYNGIVARQCMLDLKKSSDNGVFFNAISPDAYSAIALSVRLGKYLSSNYPFSVSGASRHSNGTSFMKRGTDGKEDNPTTKFYSENPLSYDERLLLAPSIPVVVMGEYLLIKQHMPSLGLSEPDWGLYVKKLVKDAGDSARPSAVLRSARHTAGKLGLNLTAPDIPDPEPMTATARTSLEGGVMHLRPSTQLVENIFDACLLVATLAGDPEWVKYSSKSINGRSWVPKIFRKTH
ncbi:glycosyltransferase family 2 protein [Rhodoferax mekongensis]|uniref:Glycosyltransferase family A protein n=1 Tax=Rhodoferax mekongensis TaxID=3068341 RepID=A0ABZ0AX49_9BURK|nr:glycosyltransferase family A protein [Rhodoferax sp. TBRC 17307]WNO03723.1 glycosyltransferase family A protein [Rhodoferax sp. TBRC 17307]